MWNDYGVYGTRELWNNVRTYNYMMIAGIGDKDFQIKTPKCTRLPLIVDEPPDNIYTNPQADNAPWYDVAYPESADFAGIWVTDIAGFDTLGSRNITATPFGSIASRRNLDPKTLTVTAWLSGSNCCATQYGYRWLLSQLMERDCDTNEEVSQLSVYDCCPTAEDTVDWSDAELIEMYLRVGYRVKIAKDPIIIQKLGNCCGNDCFSTSIQVQWTFVLENPKLYRNIDLCAEQVDWDPDVNCVSFDCDPCPTEPTVSVDIVRQKTRYPVAIKADGSWCPLGWEVDTGDFYPTNGWIDVADVQVQNSPLLITVSYDKTWTAVGWDPTQVDLCDVTVAIAEACSNTGVVSTLPEECTDTGATKRNLPIELTTVGGNGGTWSELGWTFDPTGPLPPLFSELSVFTDCGCDENTESDAAIVLNDDLTWDAYDFTYAGVLPPIGFTGVRVRRQQPGTYVSTETLPVSEAFSGARGLTPPTPYTSVTPAYCQPLEWVQKCCNIAFNSGIERAEPYLEFFSGSATLYNFKAEFYALESADDVCLCDIDEEDSGALEAWNCREPTFAVKFGHSIPANSTIVYDPRDTSIRIHYAGSSYDASSFASGVNGGTPYFVELPECYGVCVVLTAEVHNGVIPAADSYISVGHIPFNYVGV